MALVTRCSSPSCLTLFRVTPAQLQAFGGQVRCGTCGTVFDAFPSLTTVADSALRPTERAAARGPASVPPSPAMPAQAPAATPQAGAAFPAPSVFDAPAGVPGPAARLADTDTEAGTDRPADPLADAGAERVTEWEPAVPPAPIAAASPAQPVDRVPDRVPDLKDEASLDFVGAAPDPVPAAPVAPASPPGLVAQDPVTDERLPASPAVPDDAPAMPPAPSFESSGSSDSFRSSVSSAEAQDARSMPDAPAGADAGPPAPADGSPPALAPVDPLPVVAAADTPVVLPPGLPAEPAANSPAEPAATPPAEPAAAFPAEPPPRAAPELTDYSVTRGPPPAPDPGTGRLRVVGGLALLLLAIAGAVLVLAGDRLPPPLARIAGGVPPLGLAAGLVALLVLVLRRYRATWIVAACLLAVLLAGQATHAYRSQLAALYPAARPLLERFCEVAGCEVGLPKAADQLAIESSDLQAVDAAKPNLIQLTATVRNRASIEVAYPAIEITLTDPQDRPLARRVLLPDQYLADRASARAGLRANDDFSVRLTLDTTELRPVGYRLYLFYP